MSNDSDETEKVYQASPAACIGAAREKLDRAAVLMRERGEDSGELYDLVRGARFWLPTWLMDDWDDKMTEWVERTGVPLERRS